MINIYNIAIKEHKRINKKILHLQKTLAKLPEGKLVLCFDGKRNYKWFRSDGHTKSYIRRKDRWLAEQLAYKEYLTHQCEELCHEKMAIESYLTYHSKEIPKLNQTDPYSLEYQKLLSSHFTPLDQELNEWMHKEYEKGAPNPEQLLHRTITGENVRSKSEAFIYTSLAANKIPFRYECALQLGKRTYYPDFTIRHPRTGDVIYWEHFGMMDHREYAKKAFAKLEYYQNYGIIPSINLITTYETKEHPLSIEEVESIIERWFL